MRILKTVKINIKLKNCYFYNSFFYIYKMEELV